ncbi:MAG: DoxX family protein [Acidobacteriota bacterium]
MLQRLIATSDDFGPLVARLAAGIVMFPHGAQKALGWFGGGGFSATVENMSGMLPVPIVVLVILIEFVGAIALIVGAVGRLAALGFAVVMVGAIVTVHAQYGFFMNWFGNQQGEGYEYHLLMIGLALVVMIQGSGAFSVDRALQSR